MGRALLRSLEEEAEIRCMTVISFAEGVLSKHRVDL